MTAQSENAFCFTLATVELFILNKSILKFN